MNHNEIKKITRIAKELRENLDKVRANRDKGTPATHRRESFALSNLASLQSELAVYAERKAKAWRI